MKKKVLITGSTGGIGSSICQILKNNYDLITLGRDKSKLFEQTKVNKSISNFFVCDLSKPSTVESIVEKITKEVGTIDILINNAGITDDSLFVRMKEESWNKVLDTNLKSNFLLTSLILRNMIKQKWGRIINITSVVGHTGNPGQSNYCASKSGLIGMSKSIALEVAKRNITVNCISPGFIRTKMTEDLNEDQKENITKKIPLGKIGTPDDVAFCVNFLVSEKASYITGQTIHVNGGLAMM